MEKNVRIHPLGFLHFMMRIKVNLSLCIIILYASTPTQFFSIIIIFFYFLSSKNFVYYDNRRHDGVRDNDTWK